MGANRVTLRGRLVELRTLASSSRRVDCSTGNGTLFYLSNEPKSDRNRRGLPELGSSPGSLKGDFPKSRFSAFSRFRGVERTLLAQPMRKIALPPPRTSKSALTLAPGAAGRPQGAFSAFLHLPEPPRPLPTDLGCLERWNSSFTHACAVCPSEVQVRAREGW